MATNIVNKPGDRLPLACSHPAAPDSGDPVRIGTMTGIALLDEGDGGAGAADTVVDLGPFVATFLVDDNESTGIAVGDPIFYHDTPTGAPTTTSLNNSATAADAFFGYALDPVSADGTITIRVKHVLQELDLVTPPGDGGD